MELLVTKVEDAVPAPELVSLRTVLGVRIGCDIPADTAPENRDATHLVMPQLVLMPCYVYVAWFDDHVASLTVIDDG